jgi:hypothetical protein
LKRQKELKRKDEAAGKMARRHGKGDAAKDKGEDEEQSQSIAPTGNETETGNEAETGDETETGP